MVRVCDAARGEGPPGGVSPTHPRRAVVGAAARSDGASPVPSAVKLRDRRARDSGVRLHELLQWKVHAAAAQNSVSCALVRGWTACLVRSYGVGQRVLCARTGFDSVSSALVRGLIVWGMQAGQLSAPDAPSVPPAAKVRAFRNPFADCGLLSPVPSDTPAPCAGGA